MDSEAEADLGSEVPRFFDQWGCMPSITIVGGASNFTDLWPSASNAFYVAKNRRVPSDEEDDGSSLGIGHECGHKSITRALHVKHWMVYCFVHRDRKGRHCAETWVADKKHAYSYTALI